MTTKESYTRDQMGAIVAQHLERGWTVNIGIGIPTFLCNFIYPEMGITLHSEHGLLGYGPLAGEEEEDLDVINAGGDYVTLLPGASIFHQGDSFALIRRGRIDCCILGAYEVDQEGSFANWKTSTDLPIGMGNGLGGAMDLAQCSKRVFLMMEHTTRDGRPRLLERCSLPITAKAVVSLVVTDIAVIAVTAKGFELQQHAPGYTVEDVQAVTGAPLLVSSNLRSTI